MNISRESHTSSSSGGAENDLLFIGFNQDSGIYVYMCVWMEVYICYLRLPYLCMCVDICINAQEGRRMIYYSI
jgi:hypothetical protein